MHPTIQERTEAVGEGCCELHTPSQRPRGFMYAQQCPPMSPPSVMRKTRTVASVSALGLSLCRCTRARAGVDLLGLADDESVLHQLADVLPCDDGEGRGGPSAQTFATRGRAHPPGTRRASGTAEEELRIPTASMTGLPGRARRRGAETGRGGKPCPPAPEPGSASAHRWLLIAALIPYPYPPRTHGSWPWRCRSPHWGPATPSADRIPARTPPGASAV